MKGLLQRGNDLETHEMRSSFSLRNQQVRAIGLGIEGAGIGSVHHENYAHLKIFLFVTLVSLCGLIC